MGTRLSTLPNWINVGVFACLIPFGICSGRGCMMRALARSEEMHVRRWIGVCVSVVLLLSGDALRGRQNASGAAAASGATTTKAAGQQTETDEYELLAPESASFRIRYEVTATTAGAKYYYNPIRKSSGGSDEGGFGAIAGGAVKIVGGGGGEEREDPLIGGSGAAAQLTTGHLGR